MRKRRALLIGIPEYESDAITNLPIVRKDIETLHAALEKSGFAIRAIGVDGESQTGRNKILRELRRECKEAKGVEALLLYFSGHGMHYRGKDYLIPSDAFLDDPEYIEEYLVSTDLGDIIDQSDAETIIFFVDACREGVTLGFKDTYLAGWSRGDRRKAAQRSFVMVFACGAGQVSQYVGADDGFSLFTQALAEVLDPQYPACTLEEVLQATQERLNQLIAQHQKQPQQIRRAFESAVEDDTFSRVICDGLTQAIENGRSTDAWSEAALQSPLWKDRGVDEDPLVKELKQQVAQIVAACWQQWQTTIRAFPQDPWRDEDLPIRVLDALELLVFRSDPAVELTLAETALAIAVPFVREAVLASGVSYAASANPLAWDGINSQLGCRAALEKEHQAQPRFVRKAQRLKEQGQIVEKDAVMAWLLHRCLLKTLAIWLPESEGGYLAAPLYKALGSPNSRRSNLATETLTRKRLIELARCMLADFERIDRDDRPDALQARTTVGRYREEQEVREKMLAYLLKLAGLLAIDIKMLSEVIVDHIGLSDPLTPQQVKNAVNQARWNPSGRGRTLRVTCDHPAIDFALGSHVEDADANLSRIARQIAEQQRGMEALHGLPTHLLPDGITADKQEGVPVYQTPHVNFQLAHDEVRELLMGEQLYGDPMLAVRELYQNALDACRYRQARLAYLKQTGQYEGQDDWEGRIVFRQMADENGRVYIECEDNGIGMGMLHLSQCFARAGRRFADLPEFIEEQADWLKCDPPIRLYPNSQFGVGVLSYFMLADEIEVETCRLDRQGKPGLQLRVRIPGSSGLFRVRPVGFGKSAGTRVRLYLNRTSHKGKLVSCIEILKQLLWVAEFPTKVQEGARYGIWNPGELKHPSLEKEEVLRGEEDVWWIQTHLLNYVPSERGCILADGLWTEEEQSGVVINLRGTHYPKLTVDRKKVIDWNWQWGRDVLIENAISLLDWKHLTLVWLWEFGWQHPQAAEHIMKLALNSNLRLRVGRSEYDQAEVLLNQVGCFQGDRALIDTGITYYGPIIREIPWLILPYRIAVWIQRGLLKRQSTFFDCFPSQLRPDCCPLLQPGDAILFSTNVRSERPGSCLTGRIPIAHLVLVAARLNESIAKVLARLQKFAPLGLEMPSINSKSLEDFTPTPEDVIAFSDNSNADKDYLSYSYELEKDRVHPAFIVLASARLNEPIATTLKRFQKLAPLGLDVPEAEPQALINLNVTQEDLIILSSGFTGESAWSSKQISVAQMVLAAAKLNKPLAEVFEQFQKFAPLGITTPKVDDTNVMKEIVITSEDLIILSSDLKGIYAWRWNRISVAHVVSAAAKLNEPIARILQRLQRFTSLGLEVPRIDHPTITEFENLTQEDNMILDEVSKKEDEISFPDMLDVAIRLNKPLIEVFQRAKRFEPLGVKIPEVSLEFLENLTFSREDLIPFSKNFNGQYFFLKGSIHPSRILAAAYILNEPVIATLERMRRLAPLMGVALPEGEPDTWQFHNYEQA
ncbi:caspase family protein [Microcoleus sp. FACHB-1515]|uniref:wHTH domain-containing protein n=1 Tax=Cyanophyceae TaxID=3028117 RepID=UPI0016895B82|nr:caspase family protein [Microcoleus sp. FACHB-1515]MBD2093005.1 caspase family protein [Microcoleus sp. FACHB-1515]